MRLAKYLAQAGVASRRRAEEIVRSGRITVDGAVITDPAWAVDPGDEITLDGAPMPVAPALVVYALNKPAGVVSTASDPHGRPTVVELIASPTRLYPAGRLDIDTTGLILLTNDGDLAYRLTHPRFEVPRTYRAVVARPPVGKEALAALRRGVELEDGLTAPARARRLGPAQIELTIREGRNRQVKRMCAAVGHPVRQLERVAIGELQLGVLKPGSYRRLTKRELAALERPSAPNAAPAGYRRAASSRSGRGRSSPD
jgi:23S rRNA pseudouridine2605 synthase